MKTFLNRTTLSAWLPWCLLFAITAVLHVSGAYPSLRLDLAVTDSHWLYTSFTCHLVHITTHHWLYNSLALLVIAFIFHPQFNWLYFSLTYAIAAISISTGLLWFLYSQHARLATGLGLLLLLKLIVEFFIGSVFIAHPGFAIAHSAHVYGVLGGLLSWLVYSATRRLRAERRVA